MDFLVHAALAGVGVALIAGPLGSFVVWRRMAYYSDALSHAALLGVALGLFADIATFPAVIAVSLSIAVLILWLDARTALSIDAILGILAPGSLALGVIAVSLMGNVRVDLMGYLFGDLLAVSATDLIQIYAAAALTLLLLLRYWKPLLSITVHEELARVEGTPVPAIKLLLLALIATTVAVAMKVVGVLLISALLIIPASAARQLSKSPEAMAVTASALGCIAVLCGLAMSWHWDTPAGPSVVISCTMLFVISLLKPGKHLLPWRRSK